MMLTIDFSSYVYVVEKSFWSHGAWMTDFPMELYKSFTAARKRLEEEGYAIANEDIAKALGYETATFYRGEITLDGSGTGHIAHVNRKKVRG